MNISRLRAPLAITALLATSLVAAPASATTDPSATGDPATTGQTRTGEIETMTVTAADGTGTPSTLNFRVPTCVTELAFVMSGGAGGSSGTEGTPEYAAGGLGNVTSGVIGGLGGLTILLAPATAGGSVDTATAPQRSGTAGSGLRNGGSGSGTGVATPDPTYIAGGGGGAGGPGNSGQTSTGIGGTGGGDGGDGNDRPASGGTGSTTENGIGQGGYAAGNGQIGGGGGGGGGGFEGGGRGGLGATTAGVATGGGGGGGGSDFLSEKVLPTADITDFGLSESDLDGRGDGVITLAWYSCATTLTLSGTTTDAAGEVTPAEGWSQSVSAAGSATPGTGVLDSEGSFTTVIDDFTATGTQTVTVTQEERDGWLMQNWLTVAPTEQRLATCTVNGEHSWVLTVENLSSSSYRVQIPMQSQVTCTSNTVEAAPRMSVSSRAVDLTTGGSSPAAVNSGDEVSFTHTVYNTGNIPLSLTASETRVEGMECGRTWLAPSHSVTCVGTAVITRDE